MMPRQPTSIKWTQIPPELCDQIIEVFEDSFSNLATRGTMHAEGRIYPDELLLRIGYRENDRLKQVNFEVSIDFKSSKENALKQIHLAVDCAASMVQEYIEQNESIASFPVTWSSIKIEKNIVFVQVSTVNTELELAADKLLGVSGDESLVHTDNEFEKNELIGMLGIDVEEINNDGEENRDQVETDSLSEKSKVDACSIEDTTALGQSHTMNKKKLH